MRFSLIMVAGLVASPVLAADAPDLLPGVYTNEEQVYFEKEAGRVPPAWFSMRIAATADGFMIEEPDAFGVLHSPPHPLKWTREGDVTVLNYGACQRLYRPEGDALVATGLRGTCRAPASMTRIDPGGITLTFPDGKTTLLKRARMVTCWGSVPKTAKTADGKEDWIFKSGLKLHDQGGRVQFGGGDTGAPPVILRMRNVVWSSGPNRPSVVLYVHTPDAPDRAVSYAWADPEAKRIGINLRWMQASCTIDGN
jgi:hypothetical protein